MTTAIHNQNGKAQRSGGRHTRRGQRKSLGRGNWVRLYRKLIESAVFADAELLKVFVWCLLKANYRARQMLETTVGPGQFIFGRKAAARELGMAESSVRNRMSRLKKLEILDIKVDSTFSVVTICNWRTYQDGDSESGQASGQEKDRSRTHKKKGKKEKNVLKDSGGGPSGSFQEVTADMLRDPAALEAWRLASYHRFGSFGSEADKIMVQSAAAHALRIAGDEGNPAALFIETVRHPDRITAGDEDEGRRRAVDQGERQRGRIEQRRDADDEPVSMAEVLNGTLPRIAEASQQ